MIIKKKKKKNTHIFDGIGTTPSLPCCLNSRTPLNTVAIGIKLIQNMREAGVMGVYSDRQATMLPTIDEIEKAKNEIESIFDMFVA